MIRGTFIIALVAPILTTVAFAQDKPPATQPAAMRIPGTAVSFTMVKLPAGKIDMAIPRQDPKVVEIKPFWIGLTEVTWDEFNVFAERMDITNETERIAAVGTTHPSNPYGDPGFGHRASGYPAMCIHPQSAEAYCKWLSKKLNKKFRLPTEAEWEYACRASEPPAKLPADVLDKVAWYEDNSAAPNGDLEVHPVAQKAANLWGLYDTLGNVCEWTLGDDAEPYARGGSYKDPLEKVHCRARIPNSDNVLQMNNPQNPKSRWWLSDGRHVGFRVVMEE